MLEWFTKKYKKCLPCNSHESDIDICWHVQEGVSDLVRQVVQAVKSCALQATFQKYTSWYMWVIVRYSES